MGVGGWSGRLKKVESSSWAQQIDKSKNHFKNTIEEKKTVWVEKRNLLCVLKRKLETKIEKADKILGYRHWDGGCYVYIKEKAFTILRRWYSYSVTWRAEVKILSVNLLNAEPIITFCNLFNWIEHMGHLEKALFRELLLKIYLCLMYLELYLQ